MPRAQLIVCYFVGPGFGVYAKESMMPFFE